MKIKVTLIDKMGSDKTHGLAAWASTFAELDIPMPYELDMRVDAIIDHILNNSKRKRTLEELLDFLAKSGHESPFRFSGFIFAMNTDIATHIQKLKHTVILEAENGESARYKELKEDKFYLPDDWNGIEVDFNNFIEQDKKTFAGIETWKQLLESYSELGNRLYHEGLKQITPVLGKQRTKETVRYFKGYNSQINTFNKFSFDGVIQFARKRNSPYAQLEIADVARQMIDCIKNIEGNPFEYSLKAFGL